MNVIEQKFIESFKEIMEQKDLPKVMRSSSIEAIRTDMDKRFGFDCSYDEGLFKGVLIPVDKELKVVIKFDKHTGRVLGTSADKGVKNELRMSKKLESLGFGNMIARASKIPYKTNSRRMLSFQERATVYNNFYGDLSYSQKDITVPQSRSYDKIRREAMNNPPFAWYLKAVQYHGYRKVVSLFKTLFENDIRDFHKGNVGFIGDRPVLIDYGY